jgi:hypothetical protein
MNVLKHRFTSAKSDGPDATQVQPSHWNDGHGFTGGAAGDVLMRDLADPTYGAKWSPGGYTGLVNADTGTRHDWTPGLGAGSTIIQWTGASDLSVTGIVSPGAGVTGQVVTIKNRSSTATMFFFNIWSESSAPWRLYNAVSSGPTPVAPGGWIQYVWLTAWVLVGHEQGKAIRVPYNAVNYSFSIPAGGIASHDYTVHGMDAHLTIALIGGVVSAPTGALFVAGFPFTFAPGSQNLPIPAVSSLGGHVMCYMRAATDLFSIRIEAANFATWPAATYDLYGSITVPIV